MGKRSEEKEKKKINLKKELLSLLIVIILVFGINLILSNKEIFVEQPKEFISIKNSKTIEGQTLVIKSNSEYNRIIEYTFENNILKTVKIYERFEEKEQYDAKKENYEIADDIEIININEQELAIEIEKKDFGTDTGMTYEQIYDKYLVQIIGAYQIIK